MKSAGPNITTLLEAHRDTILHDADGDEVSLGLNKGASDKKISGFEKKNETLPDAYRELLKFSNGVDLFGVEIASLGELEYEDAYEAFPIHNWGNGDFDFITKDGKIVFLDNASEELIPVAGSLEEWITQVIGEIKATGSLAHPEDYPRAAKKGLYQPVHLAQQKLRKKKKTSPAPLPKKLKAPADMEQVTLFLESRELRTLEDGIAQSCGAGIYREDVPALARINCKSIDQSDFSLDVIRAFCASEKTLLVGFSMAFLKNNQSSTLAAGFTILYAIYLLYMKNGSDEDFLAFLRQRSIPKVEKFMQQLKNVYAGVMPQKQKVPTKQLLQILKSNEFVALEDEIAKSCGIIIDREDVPFLAQMACDDIDQSGFSLDEIRAFCFSDKKLLLDFTMCYLEKDRGETFGAGFVILFAIYLLYIKKGSDADFLAFLRQRSIPKVETFMKQLKNVYAGISN